MGATSVEVLAVSSWELGWDAFVAIGTVLLAFITLLLVLSTRKLAKSSEADVRAQWRPLILPAADPPAGHALDYDASKGLLQARMRNAGRGPALYVRIHLDPGGVSPEDWSLGALAAGDDRDLLFRTAQPTGLFQFLVDYRDLAAVRARL